MKAPRKAFSYARFSSAQQADGFSLTRQLEAAQRYCVRNNLTLDDRTFADMGVSGFHGSNLAGELGAFIELVQSGRVPKGSVLVIENTDRLSRLPPDEANRIITTIVRAGVDIVTTAPEAVYTARNIDALATWLPLQVSNCLAHEESVKKSDRLKDAWARKRAALADGVKLSKRGPFWLKPSADRKTWIVREREANLMRKIFAWCVDGLGVSLISERLHELYPAGVTGKGWQPNNVRKLIRSRQVLGEFEPHTRNVSASNGKVKTTRTGTGTVILDYFPPILDEATFYKAQQAMDGRKRGGGMTTGTPNLFGQMFDATDGQKMVVNMGRHKVRVLVSGGAIRKMAGSQFRSLPLNVVEAAVLSQLAELKATDVTGSKSEPANGVETWSEKLTVINHRIKQANERAAKSDDPTVYDDQLDAYATERKTIITNLEAAKQSAASPVGDTLGDVRSLVVLLNDAIGGERDELRARTKSALARLVKHFDVTILRHGYERFAFVVATFATGTTRVFLLVWNGREGKWTCNSHASKRFHFGIKDMNAAVPASFAKRFREFASGEGCTSGTVGDLVGVAAPRLARPVKPAPTKPAADDGSPWPEPPKWKRK